MTECIFCGRTDQPPALFETDHLYVMPDKYPLCPGHTLIISKDHLSCYGVAAAELHRELDQTAERTRQFLAAAYGQPSFIWENGVSGQSVYHAHLHLMPLPLDVLPSDLEAHPDVAAIAGWEDVRDHFGRHNCYRYLELEGERRLVVGHSSALVSVVRLLSRATGLRYDHSGWVKTTTPEDVAEVSLRWAKWQPRLQKS